MTPPIWLDAAGRRLFAAPAGRVPGCISRPPVALPGPSAARYTPPTRNDATPGRTPGCVAGTRKGVFTA